jgi:hypothetical protein
MVVARMGVWGKGQQSLAPPQYVVTSEREQRSESDLLTRTNSQM